MRKEPRQARSRATTDAIPRRSGSHLEERGLAGRTTNPVDRSRWRLEARISASGREETFLPEIVSSVIWSRAELEVASIGVGP